MEQLGKTPEDFGLKVRQSPTGIRITAANKMRSASEFELAQDYSGRHIEGHALFNDESNNRRHRELVRAFMRNRGKLAGTNGGVSWSNVPGRLVTQLIREFSFPPIVPDMAKISSNRSLLDDYIADRASRELQIWDVYVPGPASRARTDDAWFLGSRPLSLRLRGQSQVSQGVLRINGSKNRVADPRDAEFELSDVQRAMVKQIADERNIKGDRKFCLVREKPLLIIHLLALGGEHNAVLVDPVVTLSVCLPKTNLAPVERTYQVNQVFREAQLRGMQTDVDDDEDFVAHGE